MRVLITGAAGNLGSHLARHMLTKPHNLRLLVHKKPLPFDVSQYDNVVVCKADLEKPETLTGLCTDIDCIVHFAGVLFAPRPERFLPITNVEYVRNLVKVALEAGVEKFILISFPHVEGETTPDRPARGRMDATPVSIHAQTRLAAERLLVDSCRGTLMVPVILRSGMIYGRDVLMIDAAKWLLERRLLAVWRRPTWIHLLALPDFLRCVVSAIENDSASGVYNLGDEAPLSLQEFLERAAAHWSLPGPWRCPKWTFILAAICCELYATAFRTAAPLTRDFARIGMVDYCSDISRMKEELIHHLQYPSLVEGIDLL